MTQEIIGNIKNKLGENFEEGGFKIVNTHFENGGNSHSGRYYFAKNYFQNTENCSELVQILCSKLKELNFEDETTLVGYRNYTGLILKETIDKEFPTFNHAIIEQGKDSFFWRHLPELKKNLVIILPVACSCATYIKLLKYLNDYCKSDELKDKKIGVNDNFIVVFLILAKPLNELESPIKINEIKDTYPDLYKMYSAFNWIEINKKQIIFNNKPTSDRKENEPTPTSTYKANFLVRLNSEMQLPEECSLCFPNKTVDEKPLFPTHDNYETPNLIFRFPNFNKPPNQRKFLDTFDSDSELSNVILRGHIVVDKTNFSSFIRGNTFYKENWIAIQEVFRDKFSSQLNKNDKNIVFITSENKHSSYFLEDLALSDAFTDKKVTILRFQPSNEFVDNFVSLYSRMLNDINNPPKIIYFEDVMSAGGTFKLVSNYIKHSKNDNKEIDGDKQHELFKHGFDFVLTLIDRTPAYTRAEILKKLTSEKNQNPENHFISFFRLNVPIISTAHLGNPLTRKLKYLKEIISQCHLDSLKATVGKEIVKRQPINISELDSEINTSKQRDYFPFAHINKDNNKTIFELYKPFFRKNHPDLLTLYLTHKINSKLSEIEFTQNKYADCPDQFIKDLIEKIENDIKGKIDDYFILPDGKDSVLRNPTVEKEIVVETIVKILSTPPFIYYRNIYEPIFHYCIKELDIICSEIEDSGQIKSFNLFRKLKFFIRRSIELNSNFIVSYRFLKLLKTQCEKERFKKFVDKYEKTLLDFKELKNKDEYTKSIEASVRYKCEQVKTFFSFLLFCYKQLISKNPSISIKLEELINSEDLLPKEMEVYNNPNSSLKSLISDPYFQFTGMVKAENLYLLNKLKELHKENFTGKSKSDELSDFSSMIAIRLHYFGKQKNDPIIINAKKLLENSRHYTKPKQNDKNRKLKSKNYTNVKTAISNMLLTVGTLEKKKISHQNASKTNLNTEIKGILDSVVDIIQPGIEKDSLTYAFFVETKKKVNDSDKSSIYSITSVEDEDNPSNIELDENGLIYNLLYGLYDDAENKSEQTLVAGAKLDNGAVVSFNDYYFHTKRGIIAKRGVNSKARFVKRIVKTPFEKLYRKDLYDRETRKGVIFYDTLGTATKPLNHANMFLALRFSNLLEPDKISSDYKFEGRAVLLIMNTEKSSTQNFLNFMSNEKVRLLLLIREELLEYLQKQFDNDAFSEVLNTKKNLIFESRLKHGLRDYLNKLETVNGDIVSGNGNLEVNQDLSRLIIWAIRGQVGEFKGSETEIDNYSRGKIFRIIILLFNSTLFPPNSIDFTAIDIKSFPDIEITTNELIMDVVFPEILINMKKYSLKDKSLDSEFLISYDENTRTFTFENLIQPADYTSSLGHQGGFKMCEEIMFKLDGRVSKKVLETQNGEKYQVKLELPKIKSKIK